MEGYIEDCAVLDIRTLRKRGWLVRGQSLSTSTRWRWHLKRQTILQAHLIADMRDPLKSVVTIVYEAGGQVYPQRITVIWRRSPFGGSRAFFVCPTSGRTCEVLVLGRHGFASSATNSLAYKTQSQGPLDRLLAAKTKLHKKLWPLEGPSHGARGKRRQRLWDRYWGLEMAVDEVFDGIGAAG
jgi:hypothetical protein